MVCGLHHHRSEERGRTPVDVLHSLELSTSIASTAVAITPPTVAFTTTAAALATAAAALATTAITVTTTSLPLPPATAALAATPLTFATASAALPPSAHTPTSVAADADAVRACEHVPSLECRARRLPGTGR